MNRIDTISTLAIAEFGASLPETRSERRAFAAAMRWERPYWAAMLPLLLAALPGFAPALWTAFALALWQVAHFGMAAGSLRPVTLQVRVAFALLLCAGAWPALWALHVLLVGALVAKLTVDYCLLTRLLWLAPWNRAGPIVPTMLDWALFSPPAPEDTLARQARALSAYGRGNEPVTRAQTKGRSGHQLAANAAGAEIRAMQ